jgi:hypothetical protein
MALTLSAALFSSCVAAEEPYARITFPPDGAKLDAMSQNRIDYQVNPGPRGSRILFMWTTGKPRSCKPRPRAGIAAAWCLALHQGVEQHMCRSVWSNALK